LQTTYQLLIKAKEIEMNKKDISQRVSKRIKKDLDQCVLDVGLNQTIKYAISWIRDFNNINLNEYTKREFTLIEDTLWEYLVVSIEI